ncbi:MAG: RNA-guided pseudouridylation complex pseudouridine synthase subunit Cbf5 [Methanobrevibacter sp.]|uniref:RNA-guided pseudouridylation complex pseudouridine synthase subunit Cbf5 n=1 Tax=Methanobrevibacter sp. TaxID=66852 RepID=UPI0026E06E6D|nr:RNA-guided pseudouridylation complex pseudouridine synthase subunit Cbf5 [Methanobrevibacter sp.]MDO5848761.1 RNA-guided pseudouridylation complex pseudouridine synthase subunit Cbf5 [Methanobrevibacter sp.]
MKSNLVVKSNSFTSPDFGCKPEERPIEDYISKSVINLDKPSGPTSHEIDAWVKRILHCQKSGHGGTLDPKVTGVLPIGIDDATRAIQLLLTAPKEYVCLMRLHSEVSEDRIREVFEEFTGKIYQLPPVKSAVKRELRTRTIYYATIYEIDGRDVLFRIGCEAGTYVRTYCHNIGEALGVGAHMAELRRTQVGSFNEKNHLVTLQDVTDAYHFWKEDGDESFLREALLPMERAADYLPKVIIKDSAVDAICHGADLASGGISKLSDNIQINDFVAIETLKGELVAAGTALFTTDEILSADSGFVVKTSKVFMKPGIYPRLWK